MEKDELVLSDVENLDKSPGTEKRVVEKPSRLKQRLQKSQSDQEDHAKKERKLSGETEQKSEDSQTDQLNPVVMQASERSLRRTSRVKTGK